MKALLINGSPRTNGCTFTVLTELKNTLEKEGIDAEIIHVGHKDIHGCTAYRKCAQTSKCVFVIGAPVYYASPAGGAISFLDILFFSTSKIDKTMKVGAAVVTCRRGGNIVIPGSKNVDHIKDNFDIFDFELTQNEMKEISAINRNKTYYTATPEVLKQYAEMVPPVDEQK